MSLDRRRMLQMGAAGIATMALPTGHAGTAAPQAAPRVDGGNLPVIEASWYRRLEERRIECQLCPQGCAVADAERGTCGVRENRGGTYHTLVHGAVCSVHVDPVEKKPFFHVLPGQQALSYATAGCNVECKFCQNWEISQFRPEQVPAWHLPPDELVALARRSGTPLTAATYSEPVVFWEYVRDVARACGKAGLRAVVVSNGFIQEQPLRDVLPLLSAVKIDLKSFSDTFYREQVRGRLEPVLRTLEIVREAGVWLEIVVLLIPTLNDSSSEIRSLSRWVRTTLGADVPVHFTRFHPTYRLTNLPPTPVATLERACTEARDAGLEFVYLGNVPGHPAESTRCPGCGEVVIRRYAFQVLENRLENGACPACHRAIPGVWSA